MARRSSSPCSPLCLLDRTNAPEVLKLPLSKYTDRQRPSCLYQQWQSTVWMLGYLIQQRENFKRWGRDYSADRALNFFGFLVWPFGESGNIVGPKGGHSFLHRGGMMTLLEPFHSATNTDGSSYEPWSKLLLIRHIVTMYKGPLGCIEGVLTVAHMRNERSFSGRRTPLLGSLAWHRPPRIPICIYTYTNQNPLFCRFLIWNPI